MSPLKSIFAPYVIFDGNGGQIVFTKRRIVVFLLSRQSSQNAERAHEEEMASMTLAAQERQRELTVLLQQTEAQHQQRGQRFHPPCLFVSQLSLHTLYVFPNTFILEPHACVRCTELCVGSVMSICF